MRDFLYGLGEAAMMAIAMVVVVVAGWAMWHFTGGWAPCPLFICEAIDGWLGVEGPR